MSQTTDEIYVKSSCCPRSVAERRPVQNRQACSLGVCLEWASVRESGHEPSRESNNSTASNKKIVITDNGRGMDWAGLQNFFVMHGENVDRKEGRPGRGRFGTGKSAAFGVASLLRITTVRNRKRSTVELNRADIEKMTSEDPIPVRKIEKEVATNQPNGTIVEIQGVHLRSFDQAGIIHYIERHLARWPKNATVFVNNHECEFQEPAIKEEKRFKAEGGEKDALGDVESGN